MYFICLAKFQQNPDIAKKVIETYPAELVEGNVWNDMTWGVCNGKGENLLGKILMDVRDRLLELYSRNNHYVIRFPNQEERG